GGYAFMSHHIGEMSDYATLQSFKSGIDHFERLFRAEPVLLVHDLHPDYLTTRYAQERASGDGIPIIEAQHHHAHVTACMAENGLSGDKPVIGVCFDGTGYGPDGTIWGGEFLLADYRQFERVAHFKPMPLPGGDTATRKPARIAYAYLLAGDLLPADDLQPVQFLSRTELNIVRQQVIQGINTPRTSSVGRLFDAVASILGICHETTYEGQAAIELEACVDSLETGTYTFPSEAETLDPEPLLEQIIADVRAGIPVGVISARFHNTLATIVTTVCRHIADQTGIHDVVLSGGVFQNTTLLSAVVPRLEAARLNVLTHRYVPPNDGGLALGQAMIGYMQWIQSEGQSS
ncbi:MAG: carbamoyltransferase HypF, partial [Chloroflexota bacterium]